MTTSYYDTLAGLSSIQFFLIHGVVYFDHMPEENHKAATAIVQMFLYLLQAKAHNCEVRLRLRYSKPIAVSLLFSWLSHYMQEIRSLVV